jgi:hypothetical protein
MKLKTLFQPIVSFLRNAIHKLGSLDGNPGLSASDIAIALQWVVMAEKTLSTGTERHKVVTDLIIATKKVPEWAAPVITWALYQIAVRTGLIKA